MIYENHASNHGARSEEFVSMVVARLSLSTQDVQNVRLEMQRTDLEFVEAAINLGLLSRAQASELKQQFDNDSAVIDVISPIEAAIKKVSGSRSRMTPVRVSAGPSKPAAEATPSSRLTVARDPYSPRSEKIRALRTELTLRFGPTAIATTVAIASASRGEGKSLLVAELAVSLAQLGKPTLLVDADFRNPTQHLLFGCGGERGLSTVLGNNEVPPIYGVSGLPNLHVLMAGLPPVNPLELLSAGRFATLVDGWRSQYAYVLFDTSPVAEFSDALAVATVASRVLLVTRAQQTYMKDAKEMMRRLAATHAEILGAVMNNF